MTKKNYLDAKVFTSMTCELAAGEKKREAIIQGSRTLTKLSKQVIYALHRGNISEAKKAFTVMEAEKKDLDKLVAKHQDFARTEAHVVGLQEYVEAATYLTFIQKGKITTPQELKVDSSTYLLGLTDLTGELVRKAVADGIQGDNQTLKNVHDLVAELYGWLLKFNFMHGHYRKKMDMVRWNLNKLEDQMLQKHGNYF